MSKLSRNCATNCEFQLQLARSQLQLQLGRNAYLINYHSLLFHAGQAAIKLPSAEASKRAQCTSPGQYTPYIKGIMKTP